MDNLAHSSQDALVEIHGYVTDPKLVGYQILTNYESHYWRRLVGRDAWALYEVLRSFCHEGKNICTPSIRTLMDILGLTDRRQLVGRVDTAPGKERVLPGLIDQLQEYKLAFAEVKGEGPKLRYVFHVNLHPPALSADQVQQLPNTLQRKHEQLLKRVANATSDLSQIEAERTLKPKKTLSAATTDGGVVQYHPPLVPYHPPVVQYHPNNTQLILTKKQQQKHKKKQQQ
jgi:hypothetical protein